MIIIAGTADFESEEARDDAVAGSIPFQAATRDDEPGCLAYCFGADPVVPTRMQIYELWEDAESVEAHFRHQNYFDMLAHLRPRLTGTDHAKYRIDAVAPVYNEELVPNADF